MLPDGALFFIQALKKFRTNQGNTNHLTTF